MLKQGKQKLIILSGISGSGKTTIATDLCNKFEKHVKVNRDDLRKQLVGKLGIFVFDVNQNDKKF